MFMAAWSWGFSVTYRTGQGTQDDVEIATVVENTTVRGRKLNGGGQTLVLYIHEPASF